MSISKKNITQYIFNIKEYIEYNYGNCIEILNDSDIDIKEVLNTFYSFIRYFINRTIANAMITKIGMRRGNFLISNMNFILLANSIPCELKSKKIKKNTQCDVKQINDHIENNIKCELTNFEIVTTNKINISNETEFKRNNCKFISLFSKLSNDILCLIHEFCGDLLATTNFMPMNVNYMLDNKNPFIPIYNFEGHHKKLAKKMLINEVRCKMDPSILQKIMYKTKSLCSGSFPLLTLRGYNNNCSYNDIDLFTNMSTDEVFNECQEIFNSLKSSIDIKNPIKTYDVEYSDNNYNGIDNIVEMEINNITIQIIICRSNIIQKINNFDFKFCSLFFNHNFEIFIIHMNEFINKKDIKFQFNKTISRGIKYEKRGYKCLGDDYENISNFII